MNWRKMLFDDPIEHETKVFEMLAARGDIRETDAAKLAGEYHGIIMLGYFTGDTGRLMKALEDFYSRIFRQDGDEKQ